MQVLEGWGLLGPQNLLSVEVPTQRLRIKDAALQRQELDSY